MASETLVVHPPHEQTQRGDFALALRALKQGWRVRRDGWNGKGMWVRYVDLSSDKEFTIREHEPCTGTWAPFLVMKTVDNKIVPWLASQTDLLADDWYILWEEVT